MRKHNKDSIIRRLTEIDPQLLEDWWILAVKFTPMMRDVVFTVSECLDGGSAPEWDIKCGGVRHLEFESVGSGDQPAHFNQIMGIDVEDWGDGLHRVTIDAGLFYGWSKDDGHRGIQVICQTLDIEGAASSFQGRSDPGAVYV
ncbi:MAG: hypothetical protein JXL80_11735 [Planctomycetes bacterium]|nr:hypothetical protein [Planctomycetota bacterium]